jgi:hypothetical protein
MADKMQQQTNSATSDMLRIKRAVDYFGLSESFFRHAIMDRKISSYKLGGAIFLNRKEIEKMILDNKN